MGRWPCWQFNCCTLPPTSTKAKHPSSQTEKMLFEMEFESYKALLVVVISFELLYKSMWGVEANPSVLDGCHGPPSTPLGRLRRPTKGRDKSGWSND
eukprot:scaffold15698_cov154-Skeletonema_marinoi.AAC.1